MDKGQRALAVLATGISLLQEPKRYTFKYDVEEEGAQYTHSEASDGNSVSGFFRLRLPNNHHHDFTYVAG